MIKKCIILFILFCNTCYVHAGNNIMFDNANTLYRNKQYDTAAKMYLQMIQDGYCDADLYYNAGNAFYKTNQIGWSIWCYEKAIQKRNNKNYSDNLFLAKKKIKNRIPEVEEIFFIKWWHALLNIFTITQWCIIAGVFFWITLLSKLIKSYYKNVSAIFNLYILSFVITIIALILMGAKQYNETYHHNGIVLYEQNYIEKSQKINIPEGTQVEFLKKKRQTMSVKLPNGNIVDISLDAYKQL